MKYRDAKKHEKLLRGRIKRAREKGDSSKAKRALRQYLGSHAARLIAAYDMNDYLRVHHRLSRTDLQDVAASFTR